MALELAHVVMPASGHEAGGDFWCVAQRPDGASFVVIGDVTGHGEVVAPCAAAARVAFAKEALSATKPCALIESVNRRLLEEHDWPHTYVTAAAVLLEPRPRRMSWAYAGHPPPHRLDSGTPLDGALAGAPLRLRAFVNCATSEPVGLAAGAGVLLYTDGLEDARGPDGEHFGIGRITRTLAQAPVSAPPADIVERLRREVCAFSGGGLADDVCIVAVRVP